MTPSCTASTSLQPVSAASRIVHSMSCSPIEIERVHPAKLNASQSSVPQVFAALITVRESRRVKAALQMTRHTAQPTAYTSPLFDPPQ